MPKVVVVGSINIDVVARSIRMPLRGETVVGEDVRLLPGGKGANQAVAAGRLDADVRILGALGTDEFGHISRSFLAAEGLGLDLVETVPGSTGTAVILLDSTGENSIVVVPGANSHVSEGKLVELALEAGDVMLLQNEIPEDTNAAALARARAAGAISVLNLAPYRPTGHDLLVGVEYLVVNETEFAYLVGLPQDEVSKHRITGLLAQGAGPVDKTVVTLGEAGLVARLDSSVIAIEAYQVPVVDTTGAGDCFCGAFGTALALGRDPAMALRFANAAAALSVQTLGASPSMPRMADVEKLLR